MKNTEKSKEDAILQANFVLGSHNYSRRVKKMRKYLVYYELSRLFRITFAKSFQEKQNFKLINSAMHGNRLKNKNKTISLAK